LIGAIPAAGGFSLVAAQLEPMILGAILGGLMAWRRRRPARPRSVEPRVPEDGGSVLD
jgi:hypothetical protein